MRYVRGGEYAGAACLTETIVAGQGNPIRSA
jgi:hypothetical protein